MSLISNTSKQRSPDCDTCISLPSAALAPRQLRTICGTFLQLMTCCIGGTVLLYLLTAQFQLFGTLEFAAVHGIRFAIFTPPDAQIFMRHHYCTIAIKLIAAGLKLPITDQSVNNVNVNKHPSIHPVDVSPEPGGRAAKMNRTSFLIRLAGQNLYKDIILTLLCSLNQILSFQKSLLHLLNSHPVLILASTRYYTGSTQLSIPGTLLIRHNANMLLGYQ